ncbi:MAG: 6-phosphogluconolactonase [Trueperaceae bacterium]
MERRQVRTVSDLAAQVASDLAGVLREVAAHQGRVTLCLSGGGTPLPVYRRLARTPDLPWGRVWVAWGDERDVPPDHKDRNERAAREALLDHVPVPEDQVLPWPYVPDADPADAAEAYAERLRAALGDPAEGPWFDLTLLGLGTDGHTASLFPGSGGVHAPGLATHVRAGLAGPARLTLTPEALGSSERVWFLAAGEGKRRALLATLAGGDPDRLPASAITARSDLRVYTDLVL